MLRLLHIENIAVIERADIEFGAGLNVLTGETGAGKSIVIDALDAVTGGRVSRELVRSGAGAAAVTAVFDDDVPENWYTDNGVDRDEGGEIIVMRRISADGKSSARVNGAPVTVTQLRELGASLVDIHGQNDGRKLLDEASHRSYLDGFAKNSALLDAYTERYAALRSAEAEIESLRMDEGEKARLSDTLKYQIDELQRASIRPGETAELEARRDLLKNASRLTDALDSAYAALYGGERSDGAAALIEVAESAVSGAVRFSEGLSSLSDKLRDLKYAALDAAEEVRDARAALDFAPGELDQIEERLSALRRLMRKYGATEEDMLAFLDESIRRLEDIEYSADRLEKLEKERAKRLDEALSAAAALSASRRSAAKELEKRIMAELSQLNMPGVLFKVDIISDETDGGLTSTGFDEVRFLMSANAGETAGRISRIASGGELSRIMLAMKNVLTEGGDIGTQVFDEIDTGVSGIAAQRVAEKLSDLARTRQTLCVTHLPQIAAMADEQFAIEKEQSGGRTYTRVTALDEAGRERELARLTGGDNVTATSLSAAAEQLAAAEKYKNRA